MHKNASFSVLDKKMYFHYCLKITFFYISVVVFKINQHLQITAKSFAIQNRILKNRKLINYFVMNKKYARLMFYIFVSKTFRRLQRGEAGKVTQTHGMWLSNHYQNIPFQNNDINWKIYILYIRICTLYSHLFLFVFS